ncbi:nuclear transport factor 2 family protein [Kutzneria sp. NPDC052558]|uniref:nuclear transport factor 2 family protein n=1 Tax=Kutzneria sp. NPDC052558 TaxID=3364121 RepID=UPI0037C7272F
MSKGDRQLRPSAATTAAGLDHVRLSYAYLDEGEWDAYTSVLDEDMAVYGIGAGPALGRAEAVRAVGGLAGRHEVHQVIGSGSCVVAIGRYRGAVADVEFADVFTLSDRALLLSQRRFRYLEEVPGA